MHAVLSLRTYCRPSYSGLASETWQLIQLLAQKEGISPNQLLERVVKEYAKQKHQKN